MQDNDEDAGATYNSPFAFDNILAVCRTAGRLRQRIDCFAMLNLWPSIAGAAHCHHTDADSANGAALMRGNNNMAFECTPLDEIHGLSKAVDGRLERVNSFDANILGEDCVKHLSGKEREDYVFVRAIRFSKYDNAFRVSASARYFRISIEQIFVADVLSINAPDYVMCTREVRSPKVSLFDWPIFSIDGRVTKKVTQVINSSTIRSLIQSMGLQDRESLHIYENVITLYCRYRPSLEILRCCEIQSKFVREIRDVPPKRQEIAKLPEPFRGLQPLVERWAITDDQVRSEALESSTNDELDMLIEKVWPSLGNINAYLDNHGGDKTAALSALAETACEARLVLKNRQTE